MAKSSLRPCPTPGCKALVRGKARCDAHEGKYAAEKAAYDDRKRGTAQERGYDSPWKNLRRQVITAHPVCQLCHAQPSRLVHHWNEVKHHPELRLAQSNLVAVCAPCHQRVHAKGRAT